MLQNEYTHRKRTAEQWIELYESWTEERRLKYFEREHNMPTLETWKRELEYLNSVKACDNTTK